MLYHDEVRYPVIEKDLLQTMSMLCIIYIHHCKVSIPLWFFFCNLSYPKSLLTLLATEIDSCNSEECNSPESCVCSWLYLYVSKTRNKIILRAGFYSLLSIIVVKKCKQLTIIFTVFVRVELWFDCWFTTNIFAYIGKPTRRAMYFIINYQNLRRRGIIVIYNNRDIIKVHDLFFRRKKVVTNFKKHLNIFSIVNAACKKQSHCIYYYDYTVIKYSIIKSNYFFFSIFSCGFVWVFHK